MEPRRDEVDLAAELRMLRPAPRQEFAASLDARVAAGFQSDRERESTPLARFAARLLAMPTRRLLLPGAGFAAATIVVATAVVAISTGGTSDTSRQIATATPTAAPRRLAGSPPQTLAPKASAEPGSAGGDTSGTQYTDAPPTRASGESSSTAPLSSALPSSSSARSSSPESGPFASKAGHRDVERTAQIALGTDPAEVREVSAKVFETVHSYDGIVLSSSIADGGDGDAGARFELLIPSAKLGDALASLSGLAEVRSRHESSQDITAPTVSLGERLQDSQARIDGLLVQLAGADNDEERAEVEAELQAERASAAVLRSRLTALERRANLSRVSLRIEAGTASPTSGSSGSWDIDDALGDAGHILAIAAGVAVIGLAIVGPLALIALLAWLAHRTWVKRGRDAS